MVTKQAATTKKAVVKKSRKLVSSIGRVYIQSTLNNTIVTLTDEKGNTISWGSAGGAGFKGSRKSSPYAGQMAATNAGQKAFDKGLKEVTVYFNGIGSGRESALRALKTVGYTILSIADLTGIPHNGCRPKKARRV